MARESMTVSVTYDVITEASAVDGDMADNGWIHPGTEARRSLRLGGKRMYERNLRMARAGKFDWTLRDALAFIEAQCCGHLEGEFVGVHDNKLRVYATGAYGSESEVCGGSPVTSLSYAGHVDGASYGTLDRLTRFLASKGVTFYLTNGGRSLAWQPAVTA